MTVAQIAERAGLTKRTFFNHFAVNREVRDTPLSQEPHGLPPAARGPVRAARGQGQDWALAAVAVLIVGFAAALVALGSLAAASFVALVARR